LFPRDRWGILGHAAPVQINIAWDFASGKSGATNDYTVGCTVALMNNGRFAVLDLYRGKPDFHTMKELVFQKWVEAYQLYRLCPTIFIEDASAGQQMLQEIAHANAVKPSLILPIPVLPTTNKGLRAEAIASAQNSGRVDLPADAPWKEEFIRECEEFPLSQHDDIVDAYTWAQAGFVRGEGFFKQPSLSAAEEEFAQEIIDINDPRHPAFDGYESNSAGDDDSFID
jgi:predicted phage terminase large subunit-like protein